MQNKTAIIVISHNSKEVTSSLCEKIVKYTKCNYELLVVETGSRREEQTIYPTISIPDCLRMTFGINEGIQYLLRKEKLQDEYYFDSFWICVNDTIHPLYDVLTSLVTKLRQYNVIGEIHPSIQNSPSDILRSHGSILRSESFCEIVCPLFSRKAIELNLFDERFVFGWGLDFSIPEILFRNGLKLYIDDKVSVIHNAGTTVRNGKDEDFKTMTEQFDKSRENMIKGLTEKYGERWYKVIYDSIPEDVSKNAYVDWIVNIGANCKMEDLI